MGFGLKPLVLQLSQLMSSGGNLPFAREHIYLHIGELEMRATINDDEAVKNTKKQKPEQFMSVLCILILVFIFVAFGLCISSH